jgi:ATP-dependent DNA ligase
METSVDTLLDGELIALDKDGRVSFNLLQHHRSQARAILFYAFDVIIHRGRSLRHVPLETRRELLGEDSGRLKDAHSSHRIVRYA